MRKRKWISELSFSLIVILMLGILWQSLTMVTKNIDDKVEAHEDRKDAASSRSVSRTESYFDRGINIGNTLESQSSQVLGSSAEYETHWGNPVIDQELFDFIKECGFTIVRIPVNWDQHIIDNQYTIDPLWMARVKEVVDYAYACDLEVIIDTHHERWSDIDEESFPESLKMTEVIWRQIAETFKDYDERLLFEGFNELKNSQGVYADRENDRIYDIVNKLNKSFVDTVRSTGGRNEKRNLLVSTYYNSCDQIDLEKFDKSLLGDNILLSVHLYAPYKFTGISSDELNTISWSKDDEGDVKTLKKQIDNLSKFQEENGCQIIVTEMGNVDKNNLESRKQWTEYVVDRLSAENISYIWWDDTIVDERNTSYAILNRKELEVLYPEILEVLVNKGQ